MWSSAAIGEAGTEGEEADLPPSASVSTNTPDSVQSESPSSEDLTSALSRVLVVHRLRVKVGSPNFS